MSENKQVVCILSTMRSGSTLLKALLAEAEDVSNLPEVNFQRFQHAATAADRIAELDERPIIVLKRPAWYNESRRYPRLPATDRLKLILLVRDVYETVLSLRKMTFGRAAQTVAPLVNRLLIERYWAPVMESLLRIQAQAGLDCHLVRYEDLVATPLQITSELFAFVGSGRLEGVATYHRPEEFSWSWGRDDGSPNIKSLTVQPPRKHAYEDATLLKSIQQSERVMRLREQLDYGPLPGPA